MKLKNLGAIFLLCIFFLCALFVWPTLYKYDKLQYGNIETLLKINRITGDIHELRASEWHFIQRP